MNASENKLVNEWLDECRSPNTRRTYAVRIQRFFNWYGQPIEEFLNLGPKEKRHTALRFQNEHPNENPNSVIGDLTALNSFLSYLDMAIDFKGKRVRPRPDLNSHVFSNGDLSKMFEVGGTKEKAVIALACSLGWEVSAILELDRQTLTSLVARARSEKQQFIFFNSQRKKTGALRLGVLNPLALEWLEKWLTESSGLKARRRKEDRKTRDRVVSPVFDLTAEGVNKMLRRLAKEAQTVTTGRVHFHKIRGWVMSGLSRAGFNEFQIKYLMGKAIPLADLTYLQTLQQEIEERYPAAYERYLNVKSEASVKAVTELTRQMGQQAQELSQKTVEIEMLQDRLTKAMLKITGFESGQEKLEKLLQRALPLVEQLEKARKEGTTQN
jgi:integrase